MNNVVGTMINHHDKSTAMFMHDSVSSGNDEITRLNSDVIYNNNELGCCIKSGSACSNNLHTRTTPVDLPSCIQYYVET